MAQVTPAKAYLANGHNVEMKIGSVDLTPVLKGLPDFAENREQVETTILNSDTKTYIAGLKDFGSLEFTCNYNPEKYAELKAIKDQESVVAIALSDGTTIGYKASSLSLTINAASSGALMEMTVTTFIASEVEVGAKADEGGEDE